MTGDFNGDGRLDLAVGQVGGTYETPDEVSILLGNGDGTFQPAVNNAVGTRGLSLPFGDFSDADVMTAGDFDGSGKLGVALHLHRRQHRRHAG